MDVRQRTEEIERLTLAPWATFSDASRGRVRPEEQDPIRPVFQRDRDRIIHCKAFRRLKQKTQVFLSPEGDLYRTRLTHTLEVAQIARTIARALRLNEDLTEAIQSAAESLRSAELNMDNLQEAMNNYTITSPISGTIIEKNAKAGDALSAGSDLCTIFDLSYLEMTLNVDELQVSSLSVGQSVQVTADAVPDKTYTGVVTRVSLKGTSNGGTTTYPVKVRIDETDGLRPGMNANAEIVVAQAKNTLTVPNAAIVRGGYVLVTQDSPSAVNADPGMIAPDGYVYVPVKTGVSDDNYTQIVSGLTGNDTVAYDSAAASTDTYYDDGGYYEADAEGTEGEEGADAANSMVDEEETENGTVPAEEPAEAEEKQGSAEDAVNPSQADGVVYLG